MRRIWFATYYVAWQSVKMTKLPRKTLLLNQPYKVDVIQTKYFVLFLIRLQGISTYHCFGQLITGQIYLLNGLEKSV